MLRCVPFHGCFPQHQHKVPSGSVVQFWRERLLSTQIIVAVLFPVIVCMLPSLWQGVLHSSAGDGVQGLMCDFKGGADIAKACQNLVCQRRFNPLCFIHSFKAAAHGLEPMGLI
jgi:hypothetical protein